MSTPAQREVIRRCRSGGTLLKHAAARQKECSLDVSAHFALSQVMPLCQLCNTHPARYTFDCELDALQQFFPTLVVLHDLVADLGKFFVGSGQHRVPH